MPICGIPGFVIGIIIFKNWRNSEKGWQKGLAYFSAAYMALSLFVIVLLLS